MTRFRHQVLVLVLCVTAAIGPAFAARPLLPSETRLLLEQIGREGSYKKMTNFLTPEVTTAIEEFAKLDDRDFGRAYDPEAATPAALGAAAAGGAVAAVVEHFWDKYVGNGKLVAHPYDERTFDLPGIDRRVGHAGQSHAVNDAYSAGWVLGGDGPKPLLRQSPSESPRLTDHLKPTTTDVVRAYQKQARTMIRNHPEASWGLVIAEAAAAAVAYKAAEYALNKFDGAHQPNTRLRAFSEVQFDLR